MNPWNGDDSAAGAPAERALSFISKSLHDVQKSANRDLKLMKQRAKSFRDLANSLDKEWEKGVETLKLPLSRNSGNLLRKIRETGPPLAAPSFSPISALSSSGQNSEFLKNLKPSLPSFRRSHSDPNFNNRLTDEASSGRASGEPFSSSQGPAGSNPGWDLIPKLGQGGRQNGEWVDWSQPKPFPGIRARDTDWRTGNSKRTQGIDNWEPIRRAKESVKESLKELEVTASTSKTPAEFFENIKKTEFFENVKTNLKLTPMKSSAFGTKTEFENQVAPLDVTELLENLVRQSEPLLDQLGVKKDVSEKVCEVLRSYKRKDHTTFISSENREISTTTGAGSKDDLDLRIASVVQSTGYRYKGGLFREQGATAESDEGRRNIAIVTTASLPWMTGTAVNPLFRAAYLAKSGKQNVTLLVPWLSQDDQELVYPNRMTFSSPVEQEIYVRNWVEARVGFRSDFKIAFYPGKFSSEKRSIFAAGDISQFIPDKDADVAVLEEPEHLAWYYHGKRWTDKFKHVVGIVHTNYLEYIKREKNGPLRAFLVEHVNNWLARAYCHKVIRLSGATQMFPKSMVCNVHGVSPKFLHIGDEIASHRKEGGVAFNKGAYYLGKMVWTKGYRELVDLLNRHKDELGSMDVDVYGSGEDSADVEATSRKLGLRVNFHQGRDHADESFHKYKVFINPSVSDVVCTTTAEALAMGKNVVCADHPSNEFFQSFPNCYVYKSPEEFVQKVKEAMTSEPVPLTAEQRYLLSWEAATDRFIDCAELNKRPPNSGGLSTAVPSLGDVAAEKRKPMALSMSIGNLSDAVDRGVAFSHYLLSGLYTPGRRLRDLLNPLG
ncbi:hypothetical protein R1flu_007695 [Riccia fluitans]|uniref:Digalactosyldiacylglycerol synthase n=1 Tax=Riccia fluitans TaxID=41844 RepID=A0ABD1Z047_9MARC